MRLGKNGFIDLRLLAVPAIALTLAACGGGGGGVTDVLDEDLDIITTDPNGDADGDGVPNFQDVDQTGGVDDDFDGIDDAFAAGGITDFDLDTDGDGVPDFQDVDQTGGPDDNFDGIDDDFQDGTVAVPVDGAPAVICEGVGTDTDSSTADWADNCQLSNGGAHAESSYTRGVQRILNCLGHPVADDADFGPLTESAVTAFQSENVGLTVDGLVGPETWGALQGTLETQIFDVNTDAFSVAFYDPDGEGLDNRLPECIGLILFFQNVEDGVGTSWTQAEEPGSTVTVPFSTGF